MPPSPSPSGDNADLAARVAMIGGDLSAPVTGSHGDLATPTTPPPPLADLATTKTPPDLATQPITPVLTVSIDPSTATPIDETASALDWAHWGLDDRNSFDHKSGGAIGNFVNLQNTMVKQLSSYPIGFSWSDGTPTATTTNTTTGVYTRGNGAGFRITVAADTTLRTLKLYAGGQQSTVLLTAHLSDGSLPDVTQSTSDANNNFQRVATVTYRAASPSQLTIDWALSSPSGFVHLQSVTVQ